MMGEEGFVFQICEYNYKILTNPEIGKITRLFRAKSQTKEERKVKTCRDPTKAIGDHPNGIRAWNIWKLLRGRDNGPRFSSPLMQTME